MAFSGSMDGRAERELDSEKFIDNVFVDDSLDLPKSPDFSSLFESEKPNVSRKKKRRLAKKTRKRIGDGPWYEVHDHVEDLKFFYNEETDCRQYHHPFKESKFNSRVISQIPRTNWYIVADPTYPRPWYYDHTAKKSYADPAKALRLIRAELSQSSISDSHRPKNEQNLPTSLNAANDVFLRSHGRTDGRASSHLGSGKSEIRGNSLNSETRKRPRSDAHNGQFKDFQRQQLHRFQQLQQIAQQQLSKPAQPNGMFHPGSMSNYVPPYLQMKQFAPNPSMYDAWLSANQRYQRSQSPCSGDVASSSDFLPKFGGVNRSSLAANLHLPVTYGRAVAPSGGGEHVIPGRVASPQAHSAAGRCRNPIL
eukprot:427066_1